MSDALTPPESTLTTPPAPPEGSVLDRIKRAAETRLEGVAPLKLDLPGVWAGLLVATYRPMTLAELEEIGRRATHLTRGPDRKRSLLLLRIDELVMTCEQIHAWDGDRTRPLSEVAGMDGPVRFDHRLAEILDLPTDGKARTVVLRLFQRADTDPSADPAESVDVGQLDAHVDAWDDWQHSARRDADEESEGE